MGTYLKGNSKYYRSIGQNVLLASSKYHYENGRFGVNSPSTGNKTRNIASSDPEAVYKGGQLRITHMADGSVVTMRTISSSPDGSPVVEINISGSTHTGGLKEQKIHFVEEKK